MRLCALALAAIATPALSGCATEAPGPQTTEPTVTMIDGVRVVDNHAPRWAEGQGWRISDEPTLTLGVDAGAPYEMFTYPHPVRLANGTIVVADRGAMELRAFDSDGRHLWTAGSKGQGPGEFGYLGYVFPATESRVVVSDPDSLRITTFGPDGMLIGTFQPAAQDDPKYYPNPQIEGIFNDGSLLGVASLRRNRETGGWTGVGPGERGWLPAALLRYSPDGTESVRFGEFDLYEVGQSEGWPVPFRARGVVRTHTRGFYYMNGRRPDIEDYTADGSLRARFRTPLQPVPVTEEARDRWLKKSLENYEEAGQEMRPERRDGMVFPETMPTRRNFLVDSEDNAWAERFLGLQHSRPLYWGSRNTDPFFPETESVWDVFSSDGVWLCTVDLVPGRNVEQIGDDWVLMSGEDNTGVFRVWLYKLVKEGSE